MQKPYTDLYTLCLHLVTTDI